MIIHNIKKESLDIEIEGKWYQLTGQLAQDGFHASQTEIIDIESGAAFLKL